MWPIIQENNTKKIKSTVGIKVLANKEIKKKAVLLAFNLQTNKIKDMGNLI